MRRCRYLEETGCASVCINSCKLPTQAFFAQDMGLPLTMVRPACWQLRGSHGAADGCGAVDAQL